MELARCLLIAASGALAASGAAAAEERKLGVELNKLESFEGGCRSFFLFRNGTDRTLASFEMSIAILDRGGVIERLLSVEAAPLPAARTTLKLFEIPDVSCDAIGALIVHDIPACAAAEAEAEAADCFAMVELASLARAPLVK
jgi:hypothetical protein